jgi:predicted O-methyltransferase YrrM
MTVVGNYLTKPQQHPDEIRDFVEFLKGKQIKSYLEIGSKFGGALWLVTRIMPKGSRVVAVDLPNSHWGRSESEQSLQDCFKRLKLEGFDAHLFLGNSTHPGIIESVRKLAPYDAIFIDANHTEPYVRKDFEHYGRLAPILCFHDIAWDNPTPPGRMAIEVPKVWKEIKNLFHEEADFQEIRHDNKHNGIGIMQWRPT